MKTDKTGLEQVIEWAKKEHEYAIAKIDRSGDSWAKEIVATTEMEAYGKMVDKARALLAAEKAAMEKAQGPIASKPINPVVAAHEAEQGLLRTAIWELIGEMDANIAENRDYPVMASDIVEGLKRELEKNPPEQKPPAPDSLGSLLIWIDNEPEKLNKTVLKYKLVAILANTYRPAQDTGKENAK